MITMDLMQVLIIVVVSGMVLVVLWDFAEWIIKLLKR
jgi:hypothetical protein